MQITVNTGEELSPVDREILSLLLGARTEWPEAAPAPTPEAEAPEAPKAEPVPTPEAPEAEADEDVSEATMAKVVDAAKSLIQDGQKDKVKAALASCDLPRVGSVRTEQQALDLLKVLQG